ncbi:MFS transporter [Nocardioides sp. zg-536]|uniref:MFS transporter n=1 Tax=Nocardioides faecalis TaxID=2803858 RepID=A0A938XY58_9ACTN|nr:MFS transporter [Nocardioides faecalis]MBM9458612.1 MFS transporter [Nocardioides faecalis]QVI58611.1 MFS transporter [Nocardioides faecalis]
MNPQNTQQDPAPSLLRATGATYFPIALVARLPFAMMVVGVLSLVVASRGSLAFGGLSSAVVGLGSACVGPLLGAAADRFGQRRVLLASGAVSASALGVMAAVAYSSLPDVAVLAVAFVIGASAPQVAPMSRTRLVQLIAMRIAPERRSRTFNSTMAYESAADEVVFIVGPFAVGVIGTFFDPWAPVVAAAVLTAVFVTAFALHPTARAAHTAHASRERPGPARDLLAPALVTVVVGTLGVGLFFGAMLTSLTAFMDARGEAASAGLVYGFMGIGSAALALSMALFPAWFTLRARWLVFAGVMVLGTAALGLVGSVAAMCVVLALLGLGIGPTLVTLYSLGSTRSPRGRAATVMTSLGSAIIVGQSIASVVTGTVAESYGASTALLLPVAAAGIVFAAGLVNAALGVPDAPGAEGPEGPVPAEAPHLVG